MAAQVRARAARPAGAQRLVRRAIGMPQFMPAASTASPSDFDDDGRIDLASSPADAIGQRGAFPGRQRLAARGQPPTHYAVLARKVTAERAWLLAPDMCRLSARPSSPNTAPRSTKRAPHHEGLLAAGAAGKTATSRASYVAGTQNFYVITRYNWSSYYAMAVIRARRGRQGEPLSERRAERPRRLTRVGPAKSMKKAYRAPIPASAGKRPDAPPWPAAMFTCSRQRMAVGLLRAQRATYLAGS